MIYVKIKYIKTITPRTGVGDKWSYTVIRFLHFTWSSAKLTFTRPWQVKDIITRATTENAMQKGIPWASLVVQWLKILLPMQGTRVRARSGKIPQAAEQLSLRATTTEPALCSRAHEPQLLSLCATTTEACVPRANAPQEKPLQWEARTPQRRPNTAKNKKI